jgi:hypothetical protein
MAVRSFFSSLYATYALQTQGGMGHYTATWSIFFEAEEQSSYRL